MNTLNNTVTLAQVQLKQVIEQLKQLSTDELVNVYMDYAEQNSYERIYNLDESTIDELYSSPWQALYDSNHKDFNDRDYFFTYNGNGHMVSFSNEDDDNCPIDIEELSQWIVDNDLYNEYDLEVTTLDDMLASIEDNINDDENLLYRMCDCLDIEHDDSSDDKDLIKDCMLDVSSYNYNKLKGLMEYLGINYK